jgi:drug/metabolite transporter (DMT)-like permease
VVLLEGFTMSNLWTSRRFWVVILDTVISIVSFVVAHYVADPNTTAMVTFLVGALQPVFVIVITAYTFDDVTALKATGKYPNQ